MELRANMNLYLEIQDGETEEQAIDRLYKIIYKIQEGNKDFSTSEIYDHEIQ